MKYTDIDDYFVKKAINALCDKAMEVDRAAATGKNVLEILEQLRHTCYQFAFHIDSYNVHKEDENE